MKTNTYTRKRLRLFFHTRSKDVLSIYNEEEDPEIFLHAWSYHLRCLASKLYDKPSKELYVDNMLFSYVEVVIMV